MKAIVKGVVLEKREKQRDTENFYTYLVFQQGELDLIQVNARENSISEGDFITAEGRVSVWFSGKKPVFSVWASSIDKGISFEEDEEVEVL